jgi:hypothetical protein
VQNRPKLPVAPRQQACPAPPQAVVPPVGVHDPLLQVPRVPPQLPAAATHVSPFAPGTQHPPAEHVRSGQHGWPVPPHAVVELPLSQMVPMPVDWPE